MTSLVELGDVASFIRGVTYKPDDITDNFIDGSVVCMRTKNVQADLDESDLLSIPRQLVKKDDKLLRKGDLLVSTANSWNLVGKCCWVPELDYPATAGGFIAILRGDNSKIDARYLYHWFASGETQHKARNCGRQTTNISNMDIKRCLKLPIPLPPLPEQRRIAAILDKADALRAKRREAIAKCDQLLQSVFLETFGDPVTNPKGWPTAFVEDISAVQGGLQLSAKRKDLPVSVPYLRVANVYRGRLNLSEVKTIQATQAEIERTRLHQGDILIVEGHGNPEEIGRCAIWNAAVPGCVHQNHLIRLRLDQHRALPEYVESFLNSDGGSRVLKGTSRTTSGLNTISTTKVKTARIHLPPLAEQTRWKQFVGQVRQSMGSFKESEGHLDRLFGGLQQRAFSGLLSNA